jgi:5-methylcytosine-specific restriction endonuclease McrA
MFKSVPHATAPVIDHVIPLAAGGSDLRVNVQLAHYLCNARKGAAGGGEQLALIG